MRELPTRFGYRPGRRRRQTAIPADRGSGQARSSLRRRLSAHRLRPVESGERSLLKICVLTQYKSHSLDRHISQNWRLSGLAGEYITPVPAQQRLGPRWYTGSARRDLQSLNLIYDEDPITSSCSVPTTSIGWIPSRCCRSNRSGAGATVAGIRVPRAEATAFGCIDVGRIRADSRVRGEAGRSAGYPRRSRDDVRLDGQLHLHHEGARRRHTPTPTTTIPTTTWAATSSRVWSATARPAVYDFNDNEVPGSRRSTITATGVTSGRWMPSTTRPMDLVSVHPICDLYNQAVADPGRTGEPSARPSSSTVARRRSQSSGRAASSRLASVGNAVLSSNVVINDGAIVEGSVIMPGVRIGRGAVVRHAMSATRTWSSDRVSRRCGSGARSRTALRSVPVASWPSARASGFESWRRPGRSCRAQHLSGCW